MTATESLRAAMRGAISELDHWQGRTGRTVLLCHHNDSDGLCSAAILTRAWQRQGFTVERCCLEKPYPPVLSRLLDDPEERLLVFADFAGRIAPLVSELNQGRKLVLILDHHKAEPATDPRVHNLDPELYGLRGDRDISASTTCFLFACELDPANADLAAIAVIGAVGDRFFVDGCLAGPNRQAALEAQRHGLLRIEPGETGEQYLLPTPGGALSCAALANDLDTLGAAGYAQGGPEMGVALCLDGPSAASDRLLEHLRSVQDRAFRDELQRLLHGGLHTTPHLQWLHVEQRFMPMGVKMIGVFLDAIKNHEGIDPQRYLAGFQVIPNEIPGMGSITLDQVKISMRVSDQLAERIRAGEMPGLDTFLPEATTRLGGFSDACHSLSAATTVEIGLEAQLIAELDQALSARCAAVLEGPEGPEGPGRP